MTILTDGGALQPSFACVLPRQFLRPHNVDPYQREIIFFLNFSPILKSSLIFINCFTLKIK